MEEWHISGQTTMPSVASSGSTVYTHCSPTALYMASDLSTVVYKVQAHFITACTQQLDA